MNAHHYRFAPDRSTFIVENDAKTFHTGGFDELTEAESAERCSAHFSIGSGTRLALEDAIALVRHDLMDQALADYQRDRPPVARKIVDAANTSAKWYESFGTKMRLSPMDLAHDYLMRSGWMTEERLRQFAPRFAADRAAYRALAG